MDGGSAGVTPGSAAGQSAATTAFALRHEHSVDDETYGVLDFTRLIGIFSTAEKAEAALAHYKTLPGFELPVDLDEAAIGWFLGELTLNERLWTEGFETV